MPYMNMPFVPAFSSLGVIAPDANLKFYITETTTPAAVYADPELTTSLGAVVNADAFGRFVAIYLDPAVTYRVRLETSLGALIQEADGIESGVTGAELAASDGAALIGSLSSLPDAVALNLQRVADFTANVLLWIPKEQHLAILANTSTYDATAAIQTALDACGTYVRNMIPGDAGKSDGVLACLEFPRGLFRHTALTIPEGVRIQGQGMNNTFLEYTGGAGVGITAGSVLREHSGIMIDGACLFGDFATAGTEGVRFQNCVRRCGLTNSCVMGFAINVKGRDSYECSIDCNWIHGALVNNIYWHGATAMVFYANRIDDAGAECVVIDGQSSGGVTDIEPIGVHFLGGAIQRAQTNGVKVIDGIAVTFDKVFFEGNNKAGTSNPHILVLQGSMARTMRVLTVDNCQFFKGSAAGTTHRAIDVRTTTHFRSVGCLCRDAGFDKGIVLASTVSFAFVRGSWAGPATAIDATASTMVDFQEGGGNFVLGDGGRTAGAFIDIKKAVSAGFLQSLWNSSATAGSVVQSLKGGNNNGDTFLEYHYGSTGTNVWQLKDNGDFSTRGRTMPGTPTASFQTGALFFVAGVPSNANGTNGDYCFRTDGTQAGNTLLYHKEAGTWVAAITT